MDPKKVGKRIKIARIEIDMTQAQLAEAVDSNQKSISRYETGESFPPLDILKKMTKVLGKSFDYFLAD